SRDGAELCAAQLWAAGDSEAASPPKPLATGQGSDRANPQPGPLPSQPRPTARAWRHPTARSAAAQVLPGHPEATLKRCFKRQPTRSLLGWSAYGGDCRGNSWGTAHPGPRGTQPGHHPRAQRHSSVCAGELPR
ncbi:unnamed protein product, partial [Ixodes hexagonus]